MKFYLLFLLIVVNYCERIHRIPFLRKPLQIQERTVSTMTFEERQLLTEHLHITVEDFLKESNIVSKDFNERHFHGNIGAIFSSNPFREASLLEHNNKIDYYFPHYFKIRFYILVILFSFSLCYFACLFIVLMIHFK